MTESNPDDAYRAALTLARHDYTVLQAKREELLQQIEAEEKRIGLFRTLIMALSGILGEHHGLPDYECETRRFRKKRRG